jgi:hypothetical protein
MRKFHKDQVDNAQKTVHDSIEAFKSLVSVLVDLVNKRDNSAAGQ